MDERNSRRPTQTDGAGSEHDAKQGSGKCQQEPKVREKLDEALEKGLEGSFPGSDPVSVTQPPHNVRDKYEARKR
jgi:hypothetical protein